VCGRPKQAPGTNSRKHPVVKLQDPGHDKLAAWADVIVPIGCGDECPYSPASDMSTRTYST